MVVRNQRIMCFSPGRVAPGMVLSQPVIDREGAILLAAETTLDLEMLERLLRRNINAIWVRVPDDRSEEVIAREITDVFANIDRIFRGRGSLSRSQLRDAVLNYRIERTR